MGTIANYILERLSPPRILPINDRRERDIATRTIASSAGYFAETGIAMSTVNSEKIDSQLLADNALNKKDSLTQVTNAGDIKKINQVLMALYNQNPDSVQIVLLSWLLFVNLVTQKKDNGEVFIPNISDEWIENAKAHFEKKFRTAKSLKEIKSHFSFFQSVFQNSYVLRYYDSGNAGSWPWSLETKKRDEFFAFRIAITGSMCINGHAFSKDLFDLPLVINHAENEILFGPIYFKSRSPNKPALKSKELSKSEGAFGNLSLWSSVTGYFDPHPKMYQDAASKAGEDGVGGSIYTSAPAIKEAAAGSDSRGDKRKRHRGNTSAVASSAGEDGVGGSSHTSAPAIKDASTSSIKTYGAAHTQDIAGTNSVEDTFGSIGSNHNHHHDECNSKSRGVTLTSCAGDSLGSHENQARPLNLCKAMIGYRKLNAEGLYKQILITNAVSESLLLNLDIRLIYLHSNFNIYQKTQGAVATGDLDPDKFKKYLDRLKELSSGGFRIDTRRRKHKLN